MQYREYRQGDEPSKIDWKLAARTGRVAVRQTHDDSNFRTSILLDASASMAYPPTTLDKWNMAAAVAFGLCAVAQGDRDPVGIAVATGDDLQILPPRARMSTAANVLGLLSNTTPAGSRALAPVLTMLRTSNRIAIVSDFLGDAEALLEVAKEMVASGREVFAVHIVARDELEPRDVGSLVIDPEEDTIRRPLDDAGVVEYKAAFARWREELAASWRAAGAVYHLAVTDDAAERVIRTVVTPTATAADTPAAS